MICSRRLLIPQLSSLIVLLLIVPAIAATPITTRAGKGAALTFNEVDANFTGLQTTADAALASATALGGTLVDYDLNAAVTAAGSAAAILTAGPGCVLSGNLTVPANITLIVPMGGNIARGSYTLTLNGHLSAGPYQITTGTGRIIYGPGSVEAVLLEWRGAKADATTDSTTAINDTILDVYGSHHAGSYPPITPIAGRYMFTQIHGMNHIRISGKGEGVQHSPLFTGYQTEFRQITGTNLDLILFDTSSTVDDNFVQDLTIEKVSIRGGWTGIGDTTTTSGSGIKFNGVTPGQNVRIRDLQIHDVAGDGIQLTRHALPGMFDNIWGRKVGGSVIHVATASNRGSHMFYANNVQGDYVVGPLILVDETNINSSENTGYTYLFTNLKHEIDPEGSDNHAYSGTTVELHNVQGAVTVINANPQTSYGAYSAPAPGEPIAVVQITGTRVPKLTVIGSRMGSFGANESLGYLVQDDVNGTTVDRQFNSCTYNQSSYRYDTAFNEATVIEESRKRSSAGVSDAYARFKRDVAGKMFWGDGTAAADVSLERQASDRLLVGGGGFQAKRIMARGGTTLTGTDFALTGWGTGATVSVSSGSTDQRWRITVTAGASPSANPAVVLTYHDILFTGSQSWVVPPNSVVGMGSESTGAISFTPTKTPSISTLTFYYIGTPTEGQTYIFECVSMG